MRRKSSHDCDVIQQLAANNHDKQQHDSLHGSHLQGVEPMQAKEHVQVCDSDCMGFAFNGVEPMQRDMSNLIAPTFVLINSRKLRTDAWESPQGVEPMCAEIIAAWESPSRG